MKVIYKILNKKTGDFYIGSAVNVKKRWNVHKCLLRKGLHHSIILQRAWNKYGENEFAFHIIEHVIDVKFIYEREQFYIDLTHPKYNVCKVAGKYGRLGIKHTEESINKMRIASTGNSNRKGKKCSIESKALMKISNKGKGRPHSVEFINKLKIIKCQPILQFTTDYSFIKEWSSIKEASSVLNISRTSISFASSGKYKTAGGFVWKKQENKQKL